MKPPLVFILTHYVAWLLLHKTRNVYARHVHNGVDSLSSNVCGESEHGRHWSATGRVMGGNESTFGEFPWITSIQSSKGQHFCAGFMVSSRFVISAAHCFRKRFNEHIDYNSDNSVLLNSMKVAVSRVKLDSEDPSKIIEVKNLVLHPDFDESDLNHDIAILELHSDMVWDNGLRPICLPEVQNEEHGNGDVTVAGWGYRQCGSFTASNELHKITVPLWDSDACKKSYQDADYKFDRQAFVCAGSDGKDISKGDSGGPLMNQNSQKRWTAIGIVSSGKFMCSDRVPGVYTKVSSYLNWIKKQMI